ncbi:MAG: heme-binding protein [Verrucomicrobiota bacterium]
MRLPQSSILLPVILLLVFGGVVLLVGTTRAATETPAYQVIRVDGKFEIRDYPALTVAITAMDRDGMNDSFRKLFRFITGGNEGAKKIEMTAPVLIGTTKDQRTMSFIMPKKAVENGVPQPAGDGVTLGKVEAARWAVLRWGGSRTAQNEQGASAKLKAWLDAQKITGKGEPTFAYYDPPWTPVFLRRNEVLWRIDKPQQ